MTDDKPKNGEYWIVCIDDDGDGDLEVVELDIIYYEKEGKLWRCGCDIMYYDEKISPDEFLLVKVDYVRKVEL